MPYKINKIEDPYTVIETQDETIRKLQVENAYLRTQDRKRKKVPSFRCELARKN